MVEQRSGLVIKYPDKPYSQTPIPLFTHHETVISCYIASGVCLIFLNISWQQSLMDLFLSVVGKIAAGLNKGEKLISAIETLSRTATALTHPY